jgi:hypothetical protein
MTPRRNPNEGPKTLAAKIRMNHMGSMPTAPVPMGRTAAMRAASTASRAIDLVSRVVLLAFTSSRTRAKGVARRKIHCGCAVLSLTKNGQRNPRALIKLLAISAKKAAPRKRKISGVCISANPKPV